MQTSSLRPHVNTMDVSSAGGQDLTHGYDFGGVDDHNPLEYADFLKDLLFTSPQEIDSEAMGFGLIAARNDPWDTDMEVNLGIGDALAAVPFGDIPPVPSPEVHFGEVVDEQRRIVAANSDDLALDAGKKAFSTSVWHWVPTSSDHAAEGQAGLALPTEISSRADTALTLTDDILSKRLVPRDRDRVLSILLERCERQHIVRIASSFPTYNLMEKLLHTALHFQTPGTMQWLHVSTLEPSKIRDELLCALVAYGAILSPVSAIQNLGFAMADILFWAVPDVWGKDNATTRDLQLWQSFALILHLMFWSGSKRRTEIGESHTYPLITMLRGSNVLARDHYQSHWPTIEDERSHLEDKWRAWAVQESKIRLVHHIFIHDAQVSMTRFTGPTMSAAEMNLPLPAAHSLWAARTSQEWRMIYMSSMAVNKPAASLADHVRGALYFAIRPPSAAARVEMRSDLLLLYGLWSMVWNCQLFQSWMTTGDLRIDPRELLSFTPFSLLIKALNALRDEIGFSETDQSEKFLVLNYLNLALYAPLRCLPTFAGKDDKTEAQKVYLTLQQWTSNREGRESIWYAGQILRNARVIPKSQLQGFFAVVIYQASLTLWAFAIVIGARRKRAGPLPDTNIMSEDQSGPALMLDGSVTGGLEGFLAMGDGVPAVSRAALHMSDTNLVPVLFNPGAIMQASIGMLKARSAPRDHTLSRFVESLVQLMDDLSKAAQSLGFG
ncbi:hypothetical protein LTR37_021088 [Vermiconidia calcicola]|uniref:Uncharacterized protein n=1 Tax=Vermiconidia calcicola TaxID=1690605 RepID=A0ACC3M9J6_9PEZI|nr:hypothetical protein LTR37_021088 [Vermiconidia calcicola]